MVTNESGQVAIKWAIERRIPRPIKIDGTDRTYICVSQHHVSLFWAIPEDVDRLLAHREKSCNCGGGIKTNAFVLASQLDVNLWTTGNREGVAR